MRPAAIFFLYVSLIFAAMAEDGCPANQFPSSIQNKCVAVSQHDHVRSIGEPMSFVGRQISMHILWVAAEGVITRDTPAAFEKFLRSYDASITNVIEFHSPGGNLAAGLELGRLIRKAKYRTRIGRSISLEGVMDVYVYKNPICASACAYAFLGGVDRSFDEAAVYGLHRFGIEGKKIEGDAAQILTSKLAGYLEEMGVDQRVLQLASSADFQKELIPIPVTLAKELRIIVDANQPRAFVVEDIEGQAVATTKFFIGNRAYNARLLCSRRNVPELVVWSSSSSFPPQLIGLTGVNVALNGNGERLWASLTSRSLKNGISYFAITIPALQARHFSSQGLRLDNISNPNLAEIPEKVDPSDQAQMHSLYERIRWADAVAAISFRIRANNSERTIPIILRQCR